MFLFTGCVCQYDDYDMESFENTYPDLGKLNLKCFFLNLGLTVNLIDTLKLGSVDYMNFVPGFS